MFLRIFDKLKLVCAQTAAGLFETYQVKRILNAPAAAIEVRYKGILGPTLSVQRYIALLWTELRVLIKESDREPASFTNLIQQIVIAPYFAWLDSLCAKKSNQKYRNLVLMENAWWLRHVLIRDVFCPKGEPGHYLTGLAKTRDGAMVRYTREVYAYEFAEKNIQALPNDVRVPASPEDIQGFCARSHLTP